VLTAATIAAGHHDMADAGASAMRDRPIDLPIRPRRAGESSRPCRVSACWRLLL
jgi:hypothetical protein